MNLNLKHELHKQCITAIEQRIINANEAIAMARESANEEGKNSAGDKHETGRAMAQLEQEKAAKQLDELQNQLEILKRINPEIKHTSVALGSLVTTNSGNYYLSVAVGKLQLNGTDYFAVSPGSPIGAALIGKKVGEKAGFNGRELVVGIIQ